MRKPRPAPAHSPPCPYGFKTLLKPENERGREKVFRGRGGEAGKHDQNKLPTCMEFSKNKKIIRLPPPSKEKTALVIVLWSTKPTIPIRPFTGQSCCPLTFRDQEQCNLCQVNSRESPGSGPEERNLGSSLTSARTQEQVSLLCSMAPICIMAMLGVFKFPQFQRALEATTNQPVKDTIYLGWFAWQQTLHDPSDL